MARSKGVVVQISAEDNSARAFESVKAQVQALRQQVSDLRSRLAGGGPGEDLGSGMNHAVPQIAAASGAIREFEGSLPIRAVERFLTTTLGLGPVLAGAFPLVGGIAFGGMILENIQKLYTFYMEGKRAPEEISRAFTELNLRLRQSNDELDLSNAKLQEQIDKIEGKRSNGLAAALAEDKVEADKLLQSLLADVKASEELAKDKGVTGLKAFFTGQTSTSDDQYAIRRDDDTLRSKEAQADEAYRQALEKAGSNKNARLEAEKAFSQQSIALLDDFIAKRQDRLSLLRKQQSDPVESRDTFLGHATDGLRMLGVEKDVGLEQLSNTDNSAAIDIEQGALRAAQLLRDRVQKTGTASALHASVQGAKGDNLDDRAARQAEEQARKLEEADEKYAAASRSLADANAKADAAAQKAADEEAMSALESKHRAMLVSDADYYAQREALQQKTIAAQRQANQSQIDDTYDQYKKVAAEPESADPAKRVEHAAKLVELQAKIVELDGKDAEFVAASAKAAQQKIDSDTELLKQRTALSDKVAAQLEGETGGSTSARQKQSSDEYQVRRQQAVVLGVDDATLKKMDQQENLKELSTGVEGAQQTYSAAVTPIAAQRSALGDDEAWGRISTLEAQQQKIALDKEEAQALGPLILAYQQLAAAGDLSAAEKVVQLQQEVRKLNDPVNEVAATIRTQLDGAFESLFANMDKGQKAWKQFVKTLESDALKDTFKNFIEPGLQSGLGILIPNGGRGESGGLPSASKGGAASAIGGLLPKLFPSIPGLGAAVKGSSGGATVQIINQSSQPVQGTASTQQSGDLTDQLRGPVIQILLEDLEHGGSFANALIGGGLLAG